MDKEEAVKIFDLVVRQGGLPETIDKLVPLSFIGAAAVKFYQAKVKLMNQLGVTEQQRKATLADGQDAGEMLLNIEARIGELIDSIPRRTKRNGTSSTEYQEVAGTVDSAQRKRVQASETIHRNPAAVKAVIAEARENEDIPTKTAVLNKIKADRAASQLKAFRKEHAREPKPDLTEYLEKCIDHLIQVNSLVKQFFDHPDQVSAERMNYFVRQVKTLVEIIAKKTGRDAWKQLG